MDTDNIRLKKIFYLSIHRGCKETDYILGNFAQKHLLTLEEDELNLYERLIDEDDWDIYAWVSGSKPVPPQYLELIDKINSHANQPTAN